MTIIGDKEGTERYAHYLGEQQWKKQVLDSIEPNMTQQRMDELKIAIQVKLLDECYQITMDGVPVGPTYPMPPGMIEAIMWGPKGMAMYKTIFEVEEVQISDGPLRWKVLIPEDACSKAAEDWNNYRDRIVYRHGDDNAYRILAVESFTEPDPQTIMWIQVEPCTDDTKYTL